MPGGSVEQKRIDLLCGWVTESLRGKAWYPVWGAPIVFIFIQYFYSIFYSDSNSNKKFRKAEKMIGRDREMGSGSVPISNY